MSEDSKVHQIGLPFRGGVFHLTPNSVIALADRAVAVLRDIRIKFSGRDFAAAAPELSAVLRSNHMDADTILKTVTANPLKT